MKKNKKNKGTTHVNPAVVIQPRAGLNAHRVTLYLSPDEKDTWAQAAALDGRSMSAMVRDLVRKHHRVLLKRAGKECPA